MRVRPGFLLGLLAFFAILGLLISGGVPTEKQRNKAKILATRFEERLMVKLFEEQAVKIGGLTNLANKFILNSCRTTNEHQFSFASRTNNSGRVIDIWQTPFQIDLIGQTNFSITSAGPNLKFGDKDDIVFNSVSNNFVQP